MLRINLLPPYVFDKQKKNKIWIGWIVGVLMIIGIYAYANNTVLKQQADADAVNSEAHTQKDKHDALITQTETVKGTIADTQKKQDFIASAQTWNDEWWKLYSAMRDVTSPKVILRRMYLSSPTMVNIVGWAPSEKEAADWWIDFRNKYTGPNKSFATVYFDLPKTGYPDTPAAGAAGPGGVPGPMGGPPRGPTMSMSSATGVGGGGGGGGGFGGGAAAGNAADEEPGPGMLEDRAGINFRVHVVLKTAFDSGKTVPVWGGAPADASGGAPGPMGGPMGGPIGGPGGTAPSWPDGRRPRRASCGSGSEFR